MDSGWWAGASMLSREHSADLRMGAGLRVRMRGKPLLHCPGGQPERSSMRSGQQVFFNALAISLPPCRLFAATGTRNWTCSGGQPVFDGTVCELGGGACGWAGSGRATLPLAHGIKH